MQTEDLAPREFKGPAERVQKGLIVIYTGNGKGKSTAAFGAALRSLGRGFRVGIVQFIKGEWISGELKALERFGDLVDFYPMGEGFTWNTKDLEKDRAAAWRGWEKCLSLIREKKHKVLVFDELLYVLKYNFLPLQDVVKGLQEKDPLTHIILTGRDAPAELVQMADLVTEMREVKHPYYAGITAQPGLDY